MRSIWIVVILLCAAIPSNANELIDFSYSPQKNFAITLVDYSDSMVDLTEIRDALPNEFIYNEWRYQLNYEVNFADNSFSEYLNGLIDKYSTGSSWTSSVNSSKLELQKQDFGRKSIFEKIPGTSIDIEKIEHDIANNLPSTGLENNNLFHIIVLNRSRFDDNTNSHWFDVEEIDPDAMRQRTNWRLEWDDELNNNIRFPYAAHSIYDFVIMDPTAFQWYLTWRSIWNADVQTDESYTRSLGRLIENTTNNEARELTNRIITNWLADWIIYVFNMYTFPVALRSSIGVNIQIVYNGSQKMTEDLSWIVNRNVIEDQLRGLLLSDNIEYRVNFVDLQNDVVMNKFLNSATFNYEAIRGENTPYTDWRFYDGANLWWNMEKNPVIKGGYFNETQKDINLNALIILVDNASFAGDVYSIPWTGGLYTGLGGDFRTAILYELQRAFSTDGSKKSGLSKVIVHEIGHAVGMPHTFSNRFTADFSDDVMGYYPGQYEFSTLTKYAYWSQIFLNTYNKTQKYRGMEFDTDIKDRIENDLVGVWKAFENKEYINAYYLIDNLIESIDSGEISESDINFPDYISLYMLSLAILSRVIKGRDG